MYGDVGECVSIVAKKVQRICGQLQKCCWVLERFVRELVALTEAKPMLLRPASMS